MAEKPCNLVKNGGGMETYSTSEKVVGKWIDGKPIYQCTFTGTTPSTAGAVNISISNVDTMVSFTGATKSSGLKILLQYADETNYFKGYANSVGIQIWCGGSGVLSKDYVITAWYTKTSD